MLSCMRWDTQIPPRSGFHAQSQRWTNRVRNQSPDEIWKMESSIFRPCSVSTFFVPNSTPNQEVQNHGRSILSTNQATKTKVGDDENPLLFSTGEVASSHTELSENSSLVRKEFIRIWSLDELGKFSASITKDEKGNHRQLLCWTKALIFFRFKISLKSLFQIMEGGLLFFQLIDLPLDPVEKSNRVRARCPMGQEFWNVPGIFRKIFKSYP